jgi:putative serine protease PepD
VYEGAKASVGEIRAATAEGESTGTGFVVSSGGLMVTNAHVVEGAQDISVKLGDTEATLPAQLLGGDPSQDLAVLQVDAGAAGLKPLTLASDPVEVGDPVYAIGSPFGLSQTFTSGIVSAVGRDIQAPDGSAITNVIQTDAAINPGNSGGPLLNADGAVVGVNSQIASRGGGNDGIGFAIPATTVQALLAQATAGSQAASAASAVTGA